MMRFKLTYRQYDSFVDVLFYLNVIILLTFVAQFLGWHPKSTAEMYRIDFVIVMALEFLIKIGSFVAIFWRGLRDEYAERLWQAAAASFAKVVLFIPWFVVLAMLALYLSGHPIASLLPDDPLASILPGPLHLERKFESVGIHEFDGIYYAIGWIWKYAPFLFISLYKWHRWRDRE